MVAVNDVDPFGASLEEVVDPFASPEDLAARWEPAPKIPDLVGRLVAFIPREYTDKASKPEQFRRGPDDLYQDRYTADLVVLDGGDLTWWGTEKVGESTTDREYKISASELPRLFRGIWIFQLALIGQLRRVHGGPRPILLGRVRRGPTVKARAAGETFASIEAAYAAWEQRGRKGKEPDYSWQVDTNISPADREVALRWWQSAKDTIKL